MRCFDNSLYAVLIIADKDLSSGDKAATNIRFPE
jgi:hypothetical protein